MKAFRNLCHTALSLLGPIGFFSAFLILGGEPGQPALAGGPPVVQMSTPSASPTQTYEGMITDTRCGAKHSAAIGLGAADCTRACVHAGEQFALVDGENVYVLEGDRDALKRMAGERVRIAGVLEGNRIAVASVQAFR